MHLVDYDQARKGILAAPPDILESVYSYGISRRGEWYSLPSMAVQYPPAAAIELYGTTNAHRIAHAEASLILYGTDSADDLYANDYELLMAYKARRGITPLTNGSKFSRNAVHTIPDGCVSLIQRLPAYQLAGQWTFDLAVYQRSHDLRTAGKTDPLMYAIIGNWVGELIRMRCGLIRWTDAHPHVYADKKRIARRHGDLH